MIPHSPEAEEGVIGAILLSPTDSLAEASRVLTPEHFHDLRLRCLFETLQSMGSENKPISVATLCLELKDRKLLGSVGGAGVVSELPDRVPSGVNLPYYLGVLKEKHYRRRIMELQASLAKAVTEGEGSIDELADKVEAEIFALRQHSTRTQRTRKESFHRICQTMEDAFNNKGRLIGLPTGFARLDGMLGGLRDGTVNVIAARPGMGKSSMAMQIAEYNALSEPAVPVAIFNLEMSEDELNLRSLGSLARIDMQSALRGYIDQGDVPRLVSTAGTLSRAPIHVRDDIFHLAGIQSEARRLVAREGVRLIVVDYLQLIRHPCRGGRREEVGEASRGVKLLAKELRVPVIAVAQINREIEKSVDGRRPMLSDLKESGDIEQDADTVSFIYEAGGKTRLCVAKNRNGGKGEIDMEFQREITRFSQASL
jgi:replicative DNA helicase